MSAVQLGVRIILLVVAFFVCNLVSDYVEEKQNPSVQQRLGSQLELSRTIQFANAIVELEKKARAPKDGKPAPQDQALTGKDFNAAGCPGEQTIDGCRDALAKLIPVENKHKLDEMYEAGEYKIAGLAILVIKIALILYLFKIALTFFSPEKAQSNGQDHGAGKDQESNPIKDELIESVKGAISHSVAPAIAAVALVSGSAIAVSYIHNSSINEYRTNFSVPQPSSPPIDPQKLEGIANSISEIKDITTNVNNSLQEYVKIDKVGPGIKEAKEHADELNRELKIYVDSTAKKNADDIRNAHDAIAADEKANGEHFEALETSVGCDAIKFGWTCKDESVVEHFYKVTQKTDSLLYPTVNKTALLAEVERSLFGSEIKRRGRPFWDLSDFPYPSKLPRFDCKVMEYECAIASLSGFPNADQYRILAHYDKSTLLRADDLVPDLGMLAGKCDSIDYAGVESNGCESVRSTP